MTDKKAAPDAPDAQEILSDFEAKEAPAATDADGNAIVDFADYASAVAQAKAIGGGTIEHIGVAFKVVV